MDVKLHLVGLLLFMTMELLPMSARPFPGFERVIKKSLSSCVGGRWFKVGSFRFWQRASCAKRRQGGPTPPPGMPTPPPGVPLPDQKDLNELLPSMEDGPKHNATYDPSYGYEPYWADGEWVFDKRPEKKNDSKFMCGTRCSKIYSEYGRVCARNKDFQYKTFENYCALKNEDCGGTKRWMMLYRGKCFRDLTVFNRHYIQARARLHISSFMETHTLYQSYVGYCSKKPGGPFS